MVRTGRSETGTEGNGALLGFSGSPWSILRGLGKVCLTYWALGCSGAAALSTAEYLAQDKSFGLNWSLWAGPRATVASRRSRFLGSVLLLTSGVRLACGPWRNT